MHDILGNAMHLDQSPTLDELDRGLQKLSRRELLEQRRGSPMLVINGADDYFVTQSDTLVFEGRPDTEVRLIPGTGHVAMSKAAEVVPVVIGWLQKQFKLA
jgi:esterase FrsA